AFMLARDEEIVAECDLHTVQSYEPLRLAALRRVRRRIDGPSGLLELRASSGLCLFPARYSYQLGGYGGAGRARVAPTGGPSPGPLTSIARGTLPALRLPAVVWGAGIDLSPVDVREPADRAWLEALIWPGEHDRAVRIANAIDIVAADPPLLIAGDAEERLRAAVASAPADATLVITTPGMLVYLPRAARESLIGRIRATAARWITIDPPALHDGWAPPVEPDRF